MELEGAPSAALSRATSAGTLASRGSTPTAAPGKRSMLRLQKALAAARELPADDAQPTNLKEVAALAVAAEKKKQYGQTAKDLAGREHDLTELRERRNTAITKGLRKMHKFFKKDNYAPLHEIGDDAPSIFFECWYTSANSAIRMESKAICKQLLPKYEARLLEECGYVAPPPTAIELATIAAKAGSGSAGATSSGPSASTSVASLGQQLLKKQRRTSKMRITQVLADAAAASSSKTKGVDAGARDAGASAAETVRARILTEVLPNGQRTRVTPGGTDKGSTVEGSPVHGAEPAREPSVAQVDADAVAAAPVGNAETVALGPPPQTTPDASQDDTSASPEIGESLAAAPAPDAQPKASDEADETTQAAEAARAAFMARKAEEEQEEAAFAAAGGLREDDEGATGAVSKAKRKAKVGGSTSGAGSGGSKGGGTSKGGARKKKERPNRPDREDFFAIMFLARCKHEMGDDIDALLERADAAWRMHGFQDTNKLFGVHRDTLVRVSVDDWLMLLMRIMIMEYNQILFAKRYRLQWGLKDALIALRSVELTPPPAKGEMFNNDFHHSFYLATHIVYVQSAYNSIKASEREIPWLYRYVRQSFRYWMRQVKENKKDPSVYVDIDGIAEVCDCLRGCGMTEASDPMLCEGTLYLLNTQKKSGLWPAILPSDDEPVDELDYYHQIHPTWVCTQALRDRDFKVGSRTNQFWPEFVAKVIKDSNFTTLEYKPGW